MKKEDGLVLGEWEDERLGISPGAGGKLEEEERRRSWAGECRGPRPQDSSLLLRGEWLGPMYGHPHCGVEKSSVTDLPFDQICFSLW